MTHHNLTIFSVELSKLTAIDPNITEAWLTEVMTQVTELGKETNSYYLINNNLAINDYNNQRHVQIFNTFVQLSQQKGQLLQLIKQPNGQEQAS